MVNITETRSGFKVMSRRLSFHSRIGLLQLNFSNGPDSKPDRGNRVKRTEHGTQCLGHVRHMLCRWAAHAAPALGTEKQSEPQKQCRSCVCVQLRRRLPVFSPLNRCCRYRGLDRHTPRLPLVHMPIGGNFSGEEGRLSWTCHALWLPIESHSSHPGLCFFFMYRVHCYGVRLRD